MLICSCCGRDIDAIGQDNCSFMPDYPLCEDCAQAEYDRQELQNESEEK